MRLEGRVALVAGGAGSMGSAVAQLFAAEGAAICVADMDKERADKVAGEIVGRGGRAIATALDVCQAGQWEQAVVAAEEAFGHLDLMANLSGSNYRVSFDEQTEEMWRNIIDVNLTACFIGIKAVVPAMRRAGRGVMLHVGSLGSIRQGAGSPAYGVSKIGLVALTRSAAASYAQDNIRCVLVSPGHVDTNFISHSGLIPRRLRRSWATNSIPRCLRRGSSFAAIRHTVPIAGRPVSKIPPTTSAAERRRRWGGCVCPRILPRPFFLPLRMRRR